MILKVTDDGLPFDPVVYENESEENDEFLTDGIDMIKKLADKVSYMRALNLNNTIVELDMRK